MKFTQKLTGAAEELFDYSGTIPIIDTHEHIPVKEEYYIGQPIKFGQLFNPYVSNDLKSAGMDFPRDAWAALVCIDDDWDAFEPHWNQAKYSSYARAIRISLQKYFGVDDFTRENYLDIVAKINEGLKPGVYDRILRQDCNIEWSIPCAGALPDKDDPLLKGNISSPALQCTSLGMIKEMAKAVGAEDVKSLGDMVVLSEKWMELQKENGAVCFKSRAMPAEDADESAAKEIFSKVLKEEPLTERELYPLEAYFREITAKKCAELDIPLALHTGVWNDYRTSDISDVVGLIMRNPDTRFDVYHMGIPKIRESLQIAKNFQNAWMNMTWSHIVASDMTVHAVNEAFDMVPMNKIFAFGADYSLFIEKVYGHLYIARENISIILGNRVDRNHLGMDEAKAILKQWFYDNPKDFYKL